ncbi:GNAT family N-acetyltransferase [Streptomyces sp. ISL-11]|uniref:GNAT family N-acetyltransferase n=1 Tax=Streptomyces sp. ISL-11 TaxID=2819174 RepID=UPI001BE7C837|nr:GNAT family N-acetyltransferase [Streptomyces sp. ISL-11]MBT2383345.1 GNAT family N-acetyltransferase [Streptomyces sp. ISL-11]
MPLELRHYRPGDIDTIRTLLLDIHDDAYADSPGEFNTRARFATFVDYWSSLPGRACTIGYDGDTAVGYAYGAPLAKDTTWWSKVTPALDEAFVREDGTRTFALSEIMVLTSRRKTGAAEAVHAALLAGRPEERVTLLVDSAHPRVRALYERWGYRHLGRMHPFPDAPVFDSMLRTL